MRPVTDDDLDVVCSYEHDPRGYIECLYPWGEENTELAKHTGPRKWQAQVLDDIGAHLQNPETRYTPLRIAVASGHGIGKSACIAQVVKWALDTCVDARVVVTANTENQLRNRTWPEIGKWQRLAETYDWFKVAKTSVFSADPSCENTWRADAIPWSEHNTEAFAGLHNEGSRILLVFDEASAIADKVWEVAEGALTDANTEIIWLAFGNPTRNTGRFRECFRRYRKLWKTYQIDSRMVEGTNKEYLQEMVDTYGEDSDHVRTRVRGLFPQEADSVRQFINATDAQSAMGRFLRPEQYNFAPVILTCDPAWEGDDELVIGKRQGLRFDILKIIPKNDNDIEIANLLARFEDEHQADAVFIDFGYGTGIASAGKTMGRRWRLVNFASAPADVGCLNKRAEMWLAVREWLKQGGALPPDQQLVDELTSPETEPRLDGKLKIESKADMKKRGLPSPNRADALCLSFAYPVATKVQRATRPRFARMD